jgi:phenylalanyl-tRNA synthetase beta chain
MKVPLSLLRKFVDVPLSPHEVARILTLLGIEVDKVIEAPLGFEGVVVGRVVQAAPHPDADRLRVATVTDGVHEVQVVCGAPNCRVGLTTAFARIGATLRDGEGKAWTIKKSRIRGVESHGMLCSMDELGLAKEAEGIIELAADLSLGTDLRSLYDEPVLDVSLTPNLGHAFSLLGIARELAAALKTTVKRPVVAFPHTEVRSLPVEVDDTDRCHRYCCRLVKGLKVGPSPAWLKHSLELAGMRSVNNVVDVVNFVMLELGQPLHAFDHAKIQGGKIVVTSSSPYTSISALDGKEYLIPEETLLICDKAQPLAIAGIIGGASSAVSESTSDVLLESAIFAPSAIRKTSQRLSLKTEASMRFERGVDPLMTRTALDRAALLIQEIAGGEAAPGCTDIILREFTPRVIPCRLEAINRLLGTTLSEGEVVSLLERLEMRVSPHLHVHVPSYRGDLQTEVDIIEEVARLFGYNHIPRRVPKYVHSPIPHTPMALFERQVRALLLGSGLQECITCDLLSPEKVNATREKSLPETAIIPVLHPRSVDQSVLRCSLLPGLLDTVRHNRNLGTPTLHLFEVGRIHFKEGEAFKEPPAAAILLTGNRTPHSINPKTQTVDFFDLKGIIETFLQALPLSKAPLFEPSHLHTLHPWRQLKIKFGNVIVGAFGEIHPHTLHQFDLTEPVLFAELNLHDLIPFTKGEKKFHPLPMYPSSERDWTVTLKEDTSVGSIEAAIRSVSSSLLESFFLLDLYTDPKADHPRRSITFRFIYRSPSGTVSTEQVEKEHLHLIQTVAEKFGGAVV